MSLLEGGFEKYDLDIRGVRIPKFSIEEDDRIKLGLPEDCNNVDVIKKLCQEKLKALRASLPKEEFDKYIERVKYEVEILDELSYIDYILLVWYVINFCIKNNIPTGMGRGSAAGSLVLYLVGITQIDPIKHELFFERFVSKARARKQEYNGEVFLDGSLMADVDLDICFYDRQKVLKHLEEKFVNKTSKILTLNTLQGKAVIKDCGKVVGGHPEDVMNVVTSTIPTKYGAVKDIFESYEEVEVFRNFCDENLDVFKIACNLRTLIRNKSIHASAILLSYDTLEKTCPVELDSKGGSVVSSYDANWVSMFTVKLDVLGLRGVSVVDQTIKKVNETHSLDLTPKKIVDELISEDNTWKYLQDLKMRHGLFHIEADTAFNVCKKVRPSNIEQLSAVLALARPGAIDYTEEYCDAVNNDQQKSVHELFDNILETSGGVCLYQEQMMKMSNQIGFTLDEAEILRRIVGKKKVNEVKKWKKKISKKIKENNLGENVGEILWKILEDSANYSFNKSHSISYAALSAVTVYLKFNYTKEFYLSLLEMTKHEQNPLEEISKIQRELEFFGLKLLRPNITKSQNGFSIEGDAIRYGLESIRGVSETTLEKLKTFKTDNPDLSGMNRYQIFMAMKEAGINIGVLSGLIQAGAFEEGSGRDESRTKMVYQAQIWNVLTDKEKRLVLKYGKKFDNQLGKKMLDYLTTTNGENGKPLMKPSRLETIKKKSVKYKTIFETNISNEKLANWYYENHLLGYTSSEKLTDIFGPRVGRRADLMNIRNVKAANENDNVTFVGCVMEKPAKRKSRNGNDYLMMHLCDEKDEIKVFAFNTKRENKIEKYCKDKKGHFPKEGDIIIVDGQTKDGEVVFVERLSKQEDVIYKKLSEVK